MKVTILGATGGTGREVVKQALADGHSVTAYVRTPSKLKMEHERLSVVQGELDSVENLTTAIAGADAVVSTLGPTENKPSQLLTNGMQHIIHAMQTAGVKRLIATTGVGVPDPNDEPKFINRVIGLMLKLFLRHVIADSVGVANAIRSSDLDWTIVRAPRLIDAPAMGKRTVGYVGKGPGIQVTRADYARFLLDQLTDNTWIGKAPALSN